MQEAAGVAGKALCLRARCGSIIVNGGKVIGSGYNAPPQDNLDFRRCQANDETPPKKNYDKTCCVHAEWRAIMDALAHHPSNVVGSTLYFTRIDNDGKILFSGEPFCTVCSRLALDAGVSWFVLWHEDGIRAYPTDEYNNLSYNYQRI